MATSKQLKDQQDLERQLERVNKQILEIDKNSEKWKAIGSELYRQQLQLENAIEDTKIKHADITSELQKQFKLNTALDILFGSQSDKVKSIVAAFKENPITGWLEVAKQLLNILFDQNKQVTTLQRTLMLSGTDARRIRNEFVDIERTTGGVANGFVNVKNLMEATSELADAFGASIDFSGKRTREMLTDQITLTKQLGLTGEEAGKLQTSMKMVNMNEEQFGRMVTKSNIEARQRTGVTFNLKNLMADISKMSSATALSLMKYPKALADTVIKAKELGTTVDKMNAIADALLDIEGSITAQYEASVLTGRNLNFERARELALSNDIAGATKDILSQIGDATTFIKMNRVQQEAIAKAVGMSRDELAGSLIAQQNFNKLGKEVQRDLNERLKGLSEEERNKYLQSISDEKSAYAAAKKIDAQTRINAMQEKLYSILGNIFTILEPIVEIFAFIADIMTPIIGGITHILTSVTRLFEYVFGTRKELDGWTIALGGITAALLTILGIKEAIALKDKIMLGFEMGKHLIGMRVNTLLAIRQTLLSGELAKSVGIATAWAIANPLQALAGIAIAGAIGGLVYGSMKNTDDAVIGPDGGLVVSGAKGTYKLNENDTVVAGTNLGIPTAKTGNTETSNQQLSTVIQRLDKMIVTLEKKSFDVYLDGKQVSKNLAFVNSSKNR